MHIFEMSAQVATLCEGFLTKRTLKRSQSRMFSKVIPQITALFEHTVTVRVLTFKIELDSLCFRIFNSDGLVPLFRYPFECFVFVSS